MDLNVEIDFDDSELGYVGGSIPDQDLQDLIPYKERK